MTGRHRDPDRRTVYVDAHVHTAASFDSEATPQRVLAAARESAVEAVVVTDHDTVEGARVVESVATETDPVVVRGCEVSTADGHLLAVGVEEAPQPGQPLAETVRTVRGQGGLAVVPHPFQRSRHGIAGSSIIDVDGVEVANAQTLTGVRNVQAERFADREGYPAFGGSDAHRAASVGAAATAVDLARGEAVSEAALIESMRAGRTRAVAGRVPVLRYLDRVVTNTTLKTRSLL